MDGQQLRLYSGHLKSLEDIPTEQSNQIKIFLSCNSPGDDFRVERDAIISRVIPLLREETKAKYGLELHYVDLMFGVESVTESNDYKAREFRLKELIRAQRLSAGPSFLALLGQKYGHRPVPQLILSEIYEMIQNALLKSHSRRSRNVNLMEKWYIQDENSIPAVHVLLPPETHDKIEWSEEKALLQNVLMFGVELCCKEGCLPPETLRTYFASELENEVKHGLMSGEEGSAVVLQRTVSDLSNYTSEEAAMAFTEVEWNDVDETWQLCGESGQLLDSLKTSIVSANVSSECIANYSILWRYDGGVHPEFHQDYIDQLCKDVIGKLQVQISDAAAVLTATKVEKSRLHIEVVTHWRKAVERGKDCQGRDEELATLTKYLRSGDDNREFFTIYGDSGSGKTCVMSKLLLEIDTVLSPSTITIARFLGFTQESADLRDLLRSICQQILACLDKHTVIPMDFADVLKFFSSLLHEIPDSIELILLLDSLNSLLPDFNAHLLEWLPTDLPKNVKIIVSCQPHAHGMFTRIKTEIITNNHDNFIEMKPLGPEKAMSLTLHWLQHENMCVTNEQASLLNTTFQTCSLPLYVKLVFERVKQWRSFDTIDSKPLGTSCESYLDAFFTELESEHGETVVQHAMAYLTASKTGLSDMEMEDLLSLDEKVMSKIHVHHTPIVRRCPPCVWAKLRNDIEHLLRLKVADGYDVYYWVHAIIKSYVEDRYLKDEGFVKQAHHMIADYYLGNWYNKPMAYKSSSGKELAADRFVLSQPLTYVNSLGETHYNKRKYDQVPRQLYLADRLDELNAKVMFNYDWLYNKIKVLSLQNILADLSLNPSVEATLLEGALRSAQTILSKDINNMPVELSGRLLSYYQTYPNIRSLIDQCDTSGLVHCGLVPMFNYHQVPGSPLQYTFDCVDAADSLLSTQDDRHIFTKSNNSQTLRKFDLLTGEAQAEIVTSYGKASLSPDDRHLVIVDNEIEKSIKVHDTANGDFLFQLIPINLIDMKEQRKYNLGEMAMSNRYIAILITTDTTHLCIASFEQRDFITVINLRGKGKVISIAPNEGYVLCNVGCNVIAYSLNTFEQIDLTQLEYRPTSLAMNKASTKIFVTDEFSHIITIMHVKQEGDTQMISKISLQRYLKADCVLHMSLSHNNEMLLARGEHNIIVYNTLTDKVVAHLKRPATVMKEFRLPKHSKPTEIVFTEAIFSHDDKVLMASLFRNIHFWNLQTGKPMSTTILAPVGIITKIIHSSFLSQIVTAQQDAQSIQVWNQEDYIMDTTSLDRLTSSIENLVLTEDNQICFATGSRSDEVGVIDMSSGLLTNLLTHESEVVEVTPVSDGSYLFVALKPSKTEFCNKIWSVHDRQIVKQFGSLLGLTTSLRKSNTIIHLSQTSAAYKAPYGISIFNFTADSYSETAYDFIINYAISKPFITADDTYMVLLTADQYIETEAIYSNPSICAFYLKGRYMHSVIGRNELAPFLDTRYIVALVPIAHNSTEIIAIYKPSAGASNTGNTYGFVSIDLAMGTSLRYSDNFMPPETNLRALYLTNDGSRCMNSHLGMVFMMNTGVHAGTIGNKRSKLALLSNGEVAAYYHGPYLIVERIKDNKVLGRCDAHVDICHIKASNDDRMIMVGCVDGTILSYVMVDLECDNVEQVISKVASRQLINQPTIETRDDTEQRPKTASATWDKADSQRPISRMSSTPSGRRRHTSDRDILKQIRPVYRSLTAVKPATRNGGDLRQISTSYERSRACSIM